MTGRVEYAVGEGGSLTFRYQIVRLWQTPAAELLQGELAATVFAPLSDVSENELPDVVEQMRQRITQETDGEQTRRMLTCAYVLMGLKYPPDVTDSLFQGVIGMEESSTYQVIKARGLAEGLFEGRSQGLAEERAEGRAEGVAEGRVEAAREILLRLGRKRLGEPSAKTQATIAAIGNLERLEQLAEEMLEVESWSDLFA